MSVKDLLANWEAALAVALSQPDNEDAVTEMHDAMLTITADRRMADRRIGIRSNVHAAVGFSSGQACVVTCSDGCARP